MTKAAKPPDSNIMGIGAFAKMLGYGAAYGYKLRDQGRLVLVPDSDPAQVLVAESLKRYKVTASPSRAPTKGHAARKRAAQASGGNEDAPEREKPSADSDEPAYDFHEAKAKKEHWGAEREKAAYLKEAGELMERSAVMAAFADAASALRVKLEAMPVTLPPQLVGLDESEMRITMTEQIERLLAEVSARFASAAKGHR